MVLFYVCTRYVARFTPRVRARSIAVRLTNVVGDCEGVTKRSKIPASCKSKQNNSSLLRCPVIHSAFRIIPPRRSVIVAI